MNFGDILLLFLFGIIVFAIVKLQIYLSKKERPLYGLILPVVSFLLVLCWYVLLTPARFETSEDFSNDIVISENMDTGEITQEEMPAQDIDVDEVATDHEMMINSFIITVTTGNIGTIILLIIYWTLRRRRTLQSELKQMQLDEL